MRRIFFLVPLFVIVVLCVFFVRRLELIGRGHTPNIISSALINKPAPQFSLPSIYENKPNVTSAEFMGQVTLVNIFASWCPDCRAEHPMIEKISKTGLKIVGIDYKDKPEKARSWLESEGNPYSVIASDSAGRVAIDFGTYGVPESYLIDKQGLIRYKQIGAFSEQDIETKLLPLVKELSK